MVEPGQVVTQALKAEFGEEAMAKLNVSDDEREKISRLIDHLFNNGVEVTLFYYLLLLFFARLNFRDEKRKRKENGSLKAMFFGKLKPFETIFSEIFKVKHREEWFRQLRENEYS